jgi:hypothetical protein
MKQICIKPNQELNNEHKIMCCVAIPILRYGNNFFHIICTEGIQRSYKREIRHCLFLHVYPWNYWLDFDYFHISDLH